MSASNGRGHQHDRVLLRSGEARDAWDVPPSRSASGSSTTRTVPAITRSDGKQLRRRETACGGSRGFGTPLDLTWGASSDTLCPVTAEDQSPKETRARVPCRGQGERRRRLGEGETGPLPGRHHPPRRPKSRWLKGAAPGFRTCDTIVSPREMTTPPLNALGHPDRPQPNPCRSQP